MRLVHFRARSRSQTALAAPSAIIAALGAICGLARVLHQTAQPATENALISHAIDPFFELGPGHKPRWPRPRRSFARVRVRAPSTIGVAMLSVASTRTRTKSSAIIAALGAICGLVAGFRPLPRAIWRLLQHERGYRHRIIHACPPCSFTWARPPARRFPIAA